MTEWIEHTGDTCPVDPETVVEVRYGSGLVEKDRANGFLWWMRNPAGITHYRIITPAKPPKPEMTNPPNYLDTLSEEQRRAVLLSCPPKPEPDLITLRLECLKIAVHIAPKLDVTEMVVADALLHYVLNGSVDKA
jgi:hypothetical protein